MASISKTTSKEIKYFGRDFDTLKAGLVEFAKVYYPNTYNDFNEASPGMMFLEMAAYVGDSLNYYIDAQFKESLLNYASEKRTLLAMANAFGYKAKLSVPATVEVDVFQLLPPSGSGANVVPDLRYALKIEAGMSIRSSENGVNFIVPNMVDFSLTDAYNPTDISVYSIDSNGAPNYFLARKTAKAISAQTQTTTIEVGAAQKYFKFQIPNTTIIGIESIVDSEGNTWYEVPYLAQDTIFEQVSNIAINDPDTVGDSSQVPYLLKLKKVPRRFITRITETGIEVCFGAGVSASPDEELIALPENIGLSLPSGKADLDASIDPQAPIFTKAYGVAPSNTTLTVTYLVGGGIQSNVASNTINEITGIQTNAANLPQATGTLNATIVNSIAVNNRAAAVGGRGGETVEEIRQNTLSQFSSQNRAVTREDYIIRAYSMPNIYGSLAKVFITPDEQENIGTSEINDTVANPLALNMYVLAYNSSKQLTNATTALKNNLKNYLSQYKMLTDSINIRNGYVINIGIDVSIIALPNFNSNEVMLLCVTELKKFFDVDRWQIGDPIIYGDIYNTLLRVKGVQTVTGVKITNLTNASLGYSNVFYDIAGSTFNGVLYPSLDPSIFEVKYPNNDIRVRTSTF